MPKTFSKASSHLISIKTKGKQYCTELKNEKMQRNWSKYSALPLHSHVEFGVVLNLMVITAVKLVIRKRNIFKHTLACKI